jgi:probable rRNA maturation factor
MTVEISRRGAAKRYATRELRKIAAVLLRALQQKRVELSIVLVGDKEMRKLNARYRKKNKTTDVLSFPSGERLASGAVLLGDVIISVEQARRQARERDKTLRTEVVTLLIHGLLHLLGYDHERSERQAKLMGNLEHRLLRHLCEQRILTV